ncbi:FHA domain-containing protein [Saccharophagus sp. K07]|jgi:pSer/pThr/pTyr-binding forkhead associated (FHA) protein|uniref:FHA domain-containing protein n=1 Tax=Saccharophagus sp. K07 TaxID=2283636 RepID=UPI00165297ED|nr:FHA domain-containing protein [Saccharophagus sp. K07]MBC6904402.1 FHA domain-containing protein [Saccharophagus sp. K07]
MAMEDATLIKRRSQAFVLRALADGEEYILQGEMLVGREADCAITLKSGHVSRYHAKINVSPNGVYIEDLHSTNGTFVNGQKIKGRIRLSVGDEVAFDDISFRLTSNDSVSTTDTLLSPRRHGALDSHLQPVPSRPVIPPKPLRPSLVSSRQEPELGRLDISSVDELLNSTPAPTAVIEDLRPQKTVAEPQPAYATSLAEAESPDVNDRTQMLSAAQLDRFIERSRLDQDLNVGSGPRLIVMTAPLRGKLFELHAAKPVTSWQIGRDPHAEICINDKTISNDHARLTKTADGYLLTATHAKNGILINGIAKNRAYLVHNDKIQIGRTELVFKTDETGNENSISVIVDRSEMDGVRMRRYSIGITLVALVVLVFALFATSR